MFVFVQHDENEGEPWSEVLKSGLGNFGRQDRILNGENAGAGNAEEEFVFVDVLNRNLRQLAGIDYRVCVEEE